MNVVIDGTIRHVLIIPIMINVKKIKYKAKNVYLDDQCVQGYILKNVKK